MAKRNTRSNSSAPPRGAASSSDGGSKRKKLRPAATDEGGVPPLPAPTTAGIAGGGALALAALGRAGANLLGLSTPTASEENPRRTLEDSVETLGMQRAPPVESPAAPPAMPPMYLETNAVQWQRNQAPQGQTIVGMPPLTGGLTNTSGAQTRDSPSTITASTMTSQNEKRAVIELHQQEQRDHETWVKSDIKILAKARLRKVLIRYGKFVMGKQGNARAEERFKTYMKTQLRLPQHEFDKMWDGTIRDTLVEHSRDLRHEFTKKMKLRFFGACMTFDNLL